MKDADEVTQCYHWDCDREATRELVRTEDYCDENTPCCDEHDPMRDPGDYLRPIDGSGQQQLITDGGRVQDGDEADRLSAQQELGYWLEKAEGNVEEWGLQDVETLLLAMQEEQGELAQAHLEAEHEDGDTARIAAELDDLAALCIQLRWRLEQL